MKEAKMSGKLFSENGNTPLKSALENNSLVLLAKVFALAFLRFLLVRVTRNSTYYCKFAVLITSTRVVFFFHCKSYLRSEDE
jgi:hypothetical protein